MSEAGPQVAPATISFERILPGSPAHAWRFWAEPELRRRWAGCHPDWTELEHVTRFETGGIELSRARDAEGIVHLVDMRYLDLHAPSRIIYAYSMRQDDRLISASLVSIDLVDLGNRRTSMRYDEHLRMFVGNPDQRRAGTMLGYDRLQSEIALFPEIAHRPELTH